jgi:hypothetical protein
MLAGARTPLLAGRAHRLMAGALATACWLAAPAGASAQQGPPLDVSGLTGAATGAVAATGSAVERTVTVAAPLAGPAQDTVTQVAGAVGRVTGPQGPVAEGLTRAAAPVAGAVDRLSGPAPPVRGTVERLTRAVAPVAGAVERVVPGGRRTDDEPPGAATTVDETIQGATGVDEALRDATGTARQAGADNGTAGAVAGQGSPRVERLSGPPSGGETSRASQLRLRGTAASEPADMALPGSHGEPLSSIFTALIPGPPIGLPGTPVGGDDRGSAAADSGAPGPPAGPDPVPGPAGGSSAAGASLSFVLGGLALLLATLSLAGPALRRRLPRRPVIAWPAAFVPLLERPG